VADLFRVHTADTTIRSRLLSLMSFFDRQGIPEALLQTRASPRGAQRSQKEPKHDEEDNASQSSTSAESEDTFEDDVVALRNFCFISNETGGMSFEMHALVQLATRVWLKANNKLEQ
jgi:hypothetical protein